MERAIQLSGQLIPTGHARNAVDIGIPAVGSFILSGAISGGSPAAFRADSSPVTGCYSTDFEASSRLMISLSMCSLAAGLCSHTPMAS